MHSSCVVPALGEEPEDEMSMNMYQVELLYSGILYLLDTHYQVCCTVAYYIY